MNNGHFGNGSRKNIFNAVVVIALLIMIGRLYQLQLVYQDEWGKISRDNSVRTVLSEPVRGLMYDRRGRLIVDNHPSYTVIVTPSEFRMEAIPDLALLLDLDEQTLSDRIQRARAWSRFVPSKIQRDVDYRAIVHLEEFRDRYPGVGYIVEAKRHYNSRARMSHLLGYTKEISEHQLARQPDVYRPGDVIGSSGIEASYEYVLRGERGFEYIVVNARGQFVSDYFEGRKNVPSREGSDLFLTIDAELQAYAEDLLGEHRGSIVAIDPQTGGVLALVSKPDYDLSYFSGVTPPDIWMALNADSSRPLFNRAVSSIYPPGSTYKMVLAAAALEEGIINERWTASCPGWYRFGNRIFRCHRPEGHGAMNVVEAIQKSCNVFFYQLILDVGFERWVQYGRLFGFGQRSGIGTIDETAGILPTPDFYNRIYGIGQWTRGNLISLAIGQGEVSVTPLQMAVYSMLLANKGKYHQPHLVSHVYHAETRSIFELPYETKTINLSDKTWELIRRGMNRVVDADGGTGRGAQIRGVSSAGKTGTSQNPHGEGHAWYIGFAPYDHPQIAVAVVIENVGFGGRHAAPVAGRLIEHYLQNTIIHDRIPHTVPVVHDRRLNGGEDR
jgi:penicillin-binding protein 2